eukprot:CAMPEP_0117543892 /NCGR_PEP_ID=MMETSP0784-20121206/45292_1 /TAXON_ID=39447 /ORGANISM="" /LENGTH=477 /DNA_ID=CAMNT_0005340679 /DNA_START=248 /DNA_END=1678 /DNA_ORIENTATION=+
MPPAPSSTDEPPSLEISMCVIGNGTSGLSNHSNSPSMTAWDESIPLEQAMLRQPLSLVLPAKGVRRREHFSRWRCLGDLEEPSKLEDRACVFSNVCYNRSLRDFVFFRSSEQDGLAPIIFDHRTGSQFLFPRRPRGAVEDKSGEHVDFLHLNYHRHSAGALKSWDPDSSQGGAITWSLQMREERIPAGHKSLPGVYAFGAPHRDTVNVGHVVWEDSFAIFVNMIRLGVYTACLNIIRSQPCERTAAYGTAGRCRKFEEGFLHPLTASCGTVLQFAELLQRHEEDLLCFEHLIVGGTFGMFDSDSHNVGKEPYIRFYRQVILTWHGVSPWARPESHQILLVRKDGKRRILNFNEVAASVSHNFKHIAHVCYTSFGEMSIADQLRMLQQVTIAVSPCGGISMMLPFLPTGAYVILMNYALKLGWFRKSGSHGECDGCSWTMEGELWKHVPHIRKLYYQVLGPSDVENGVVGRHSSIVVD